MRIGSFPTYQPQTFKGLEGAQNLSKIGATGDASGIATAQPSGAVQKSNFSNFIERAVGNVDDKMKAAELEKNKLFTGETGNLHQAMIASQEASVSFSLMVEVRNKLVESYQELMRMQV
jgi:flagellar hook-basal body complex protein FliE